MLSTTPPEKDRPAKARARRGGEAAARARAGMRGRVLAAVAATILIWGFAFIPLKHLLNPEYSSHPLSAEGFLILRFVPLLPLLLVLLAWRARSETPEAFRISSSFRP